MISECLILSDKLAKEVGLIKQEYKKDIQSLAEAAKKEKETYELTLLNQTNDIKNM